MPGSDSAKSETPPARGGRDGLRANNATVSESTHRLVAAIPVCVFLAVLVVFTAFSRFMHGQEDERIQLGTGLTADDVKYRLERYIAMRLSLLEHIRDDWSKGAIAGEPAFHVHAADLRQYFTGIVAINWVDAGGVIRWVEPEAGNRQAKGRDLSENEVAGPVLDAARRTGRLHASPPLDLYQGGRGFAAYAPIVRDGEVRGFINAAFRHTPLIRECLAGDVARRHYYSITDGEEHIHSWTDDSDLDGLPFAETRHIQVADRSWTVTLRPTRVQVAAARTWADELALVLGVLAAFGLASVSYRLARSRALLRTSRERYRNVVDDTPAMICRYLPDGTITFVNLAYARSVGMQPRDLIGASYFERLPDEQRASIRAALDALGAETPSRVHELEIDAEPHGRSWQQWIDRALFDESGGVAEFQSVGLDVTAMRRVQNELRRSEERFRTIFNAVADGILLFDQRGELRDVNERACGMFGMGRDELLGRGVDALSSAGAAGIREWLGHTATHGHFAFSDWNVHNADGSRWQAELELRRTTIAGAPRIVAVVRDVTARTQLAEQLRQSQKMEAMGTLAGGIAHDFNNILTAIMGHAELARMTIDSSSAEARSMEGIVAACEQATGVTRSLLTFSRRGETPRIGVDLATLVRDTLRLLRPLLPGAIEIKSEISTREAMWVDADTSQIQQVLMNLALNARDAMPNGGSLYVSVTCESTYDSAKAARDWSEDAVVTVRDTGVGMSEEVLSRVLEPFFTTKTRERGTGLGMSVVHGIVSSHGGALEIDSVEGEGTTIRVVLPRRDAPVAIEPKQEVPAPRSPNVRARAMVVEDNAQVRRLLSSVLARHGFRVDEEQNGATALEHYMERGLAWDLIVLDIDLPGMTGTECLQRIRESGDDLPAILISGNPEFAPDADAHGDVRFLQKPFTMREFAAAATEMASARMAAS